MTGLLIVGILLVAIAFCLNSDAPEGLSSPWTYKIMVAIVRIITLLGKISKMLGFTESFVEFNKKLEKPQSIPAEYAHIETEDVVFDGVPVRIYRKPGIPDSDNPALLYIHGGGFALMSVVLASAQMLCTEAYDDVTRHLCHHTNTVVVSVDYRLTPAHPYPAAIDDCVTAYGHLAKKAHLYGVDSNRIGVAGDSAGGNLATAVSLRLRDEQFKPQPRYQVLIYPITQLLDVLTPSFQQYRQGGIFTLDMASESWSMYVMGNTSFANEFKFNNHVTKDVREKYAETYINHRDVPQELIHQSYERPKITEGNRQLWEEIKHIVLSSYVSPLIAEDLSGLPPAYVITCEMDVLRDDGILYYKRLQAAGNKVTHKHYKASFHSVLNNWRLFKEGEDMLQDVENFIFENK